MSCMTLFALPTMATTRLAQTTCLETSERWPVNPTAERNLSMSWVVVTDERGNRRLRMCWTVAEERQN
jgi:hypothetical protein